MTDVSFNIAANGDDGYNWVNLTFINGLTVIEIGNANTGGARHSFFRFQNVTIPSGAVIDSAVLRLQSSTSWSQSTVNVNIYFEDEDNTTAPSSGSDLDGRSVGSAIAWNSIGAWSPGSDYDTPELSTILQAVIDRAGWASGQAVTVHVKDNGSTANSERGAAAREHTTYSEARLVVSYHVPNNIDVWESVSISESVLIEFDLIAQENIGVSESIGIERGFDGLLETVQDITINESFTVERGFAGVVSEIQNINIYEFSYIDIGPEISVFELITVNDYGNIQPEFSVSDNFSLTESLTVRRGYQVAVDESFSFSDTFTLFNYTSWFRTNKAKSKERFFFTLTGITDNTTDIEIPVSSIYATKRSGDPSYLQVVVPSLNYSGEIAIRSNAQMQVDLGYEFEGVINLREQILVADLDDIRVDEGPVNRSVTLSGHRTIDYGGNLVTFSRADVTYRAVQTRARVFRFAFIDPFLNPGDTVVIDYESFTCNNIVYIINARSAMMEVKEAL